MGGPHVIRGRPNVTRSHFPAAAPATSVGLHRRRRRTATTRDARQSLRRRVFQPRMAPSDGGAVIRSTLAISSHVSSSTKQRVRPNKGSAQAKGPPRMLGSGPEYSICAELSFAAGRARRWREPEADPWPPLYHVAEVRPGPLHSKSDESGPPHRRVPQGRTGEAGNGRHTFLAISDEEPLGAQGPGR